MNIDTTLEFNQASILPGIAEATKAFNAETQLNEALKNTMEQRFGEPAAILDSVNNLDA